MYDDVIKWKHFPRNWPFVRGIHRSPVNSPHKDRWHWDLMFSLIYAWINEWVNNREGGDLRRHRAHYDAIVMNLRKVGRLSCLYSQSLSANIILIKPDSFHNWNFHNLITTLNRSKLRMMVVISVIFFAAPQCCLNSNYAADHLFVDVQVDDRKFNIKNLSLSDHLV